MNTFTDQLLVFVMLLNFLVLGVSSINVSIRAVALQGIALGLLPLLLHPISWRISILALVIVLAKGIIIPSLLRRAMLRVPIRREIEPYLGYVPSLLIGALATALSFAFASKLPLASGHNEHLLVPAALATFVTGFLVLTTRRKAITQVIGYLLLENGIFIFGQLLTEAIPFMVEAATLLDLIVGIFVMGIIINQISREFSSIDTARLTALKE
ncbi:MAG TPA: hydrogenase [Geobacterales bacterium]|nr:hydrogenase [Geobacterales bacterium]